MSAPKYLQWLAPDSLKTKVAQRFAAFCLEDIQDQDKAGILDQPVYEAAVKRILDHFEGVEQEDQAQ